MKQLSNYINEGFFSNVAAGLYEYREIFNTDVAKRWPSTSTIDKLKFNRERVIPLIKALPEGKALCIHVDADKAMDPYKYQVKYYIKQYPYGQDRCYIKKDIMSSLTPNKKGHYSPNEPIITAYSEIMNSLIQWYEKNI